MLSRDPVRWVWVIYGFMQAVMIALLAAGVASEVVVALINSILLAFYIAVNELFVRPNTVPLKPLQELAAAEAQRQ